MTISRTRPVIFLRRSTSSKARRRVQNLLLLKRQQRERPSNSTPKDLNYCDTSDLWRVRPFSVNKSLLCFTTISASCRVFAITLPEHLSVDPRKDPLFCHEDGIDLPTTDQETQWSLSRCEQNTETTNILWVALTRPTSHSHAQLCTHSATKYCPGYRPLLLSLESG